MKLQKISSQEVVNLLILIERDNIDVELCYMVINEFGCLPSDMFDSDVIFIIVYCVFLFI